MDAFAGIVKPIEAKVRKGKGAVGAYGNERTQQSIQDFPVVDSEEEEEKVSCFWIVIFGLITMSALRTETLILVLASF